MFSGKLRPLAVALIVGLAPATLALAVAPATLQAQRPTAEQAQQLLQSRPDLVRQLRDRIGASGLTPDQVRARLRAEGYPENLLDAYLSGSSDSTAVPTEDTFSAVQALGITDENDVDDLRVEAGLQPLRPRSSRATTRGAGRLTTADQSLLGDTTGLGEQRRPTRRYITSDDWYGTMSAREKARAAKADSARLDTRLPDSTTLAARRRVAASQPAAAADSTGLPIFGLDVFENATSQFDPNAGGPVDANYRIGPGDRLVLVLTGDVEAAYTLDVTRQGFVVVPQVGQIDVANLTMAQLEDVLYSRLGRVYSGIRRGAGATTHFSISPARLRSNQVFVIGDVDQPGSYRVSAAGTALTALYAAGGPTEVGSLRRVEIRRGGRTVDVLDVYDYLLHGDASHDPRLENGDVVFVPVHGPRVRVEGEVVRPAIYEMKPNETLADVLQAAGGFRAQASTARIQIDRIVPPSQRTTDGRDRITIDVASSQLATGGAPAFPMVNGDVVRVFEVAERVRDRVTVLGNVWTPGTLGLAPGMTVSQALRSAGGLKPDTYLGQVLVTRLRPDSTRIQLRTTLLDTTGRVSNDFRLAEDDEIRVFSVTEFRPTRYVAVSGAVRRAGRYPYREGMTMRDLVLLAGGLKEGAYLKEAEVARLPESRQAGQLATTTRVPLDSSYLFERAPDGHYIGAPGLPASSGPSAEVPLQPYDNVLIMQQPGWELQRQVTVTGEVQYPGTYTLQTKTDRLSDVIQRAGGLMGDGYAGGVVFYRKENGTGRIGIDLPRVLRDANDRDNLVLQNGDSIYIPTYTGTVNVGGAVNSPVAVSYVPGRDIDYYIDAAGGPSIKAAPKRAYVTQANGKVQSKHDRWWIIPDFKPKPGPGSTVFVPDADPADKKDLAATIQVASTLAQVLGSLVAIAVVIVSARKK